LLEIDWILISKSCSIFLIGNIDPPGRILSGWFSFIHCIILMDVFEHLARIR
jgi:hypothetical protein